jgi:hypothetical protein
MAVVILAILPIAWLATDSANAAVSSATTTAPTSLGQSAPPSTADTQAELSQVNDRIDSLYGTILVPVGLLITLIAGGSVIGVVATLRSGTADRTAA